MLQEVCQVVVEPIQVSATHIDIGTTHVTRYIMSYVVVENDGRCQLIFKRLQAVTKLKVLIVKEMVIEEALTV